MTSYRFYYKIKLHLLQYSRRPQKYHLGNINMRSFHHFEYYSNHMKFSNGCIPAEKHPSMLGWIYRLHCYHRYRNLFNQISNNTVICKSLHILKHVYYKSIKIVATHSLIKKGGDARCDQWPNR